MSLVEPPVRPAAEVSPNIFEQHTAARFWIGQVSAKGVVERPEYFDGLTRLRANTYVHELNFLSSDHLDAEGREIDVDDDRAVNFAVVENNYHSASVVGSGRLIVKRAMDDELPIENHFPEIFQDVPAANGSVEVSRFIARHHDAPTQHRVGLAVIRALTFHAVETGADPTAYAIIEKPLARLLTDIGLPVKKLAEPHDIPELGGKLMPVSINPYVIIQSLKERSRDTILLRRFFKTEEKNGGQGYYDGTLVGGHRE